MANRSGSADLPLHGGRVPAWLAQRMTRLGRVIIEAIVHEYGRQELLRRLAHPFWFQSFGAVMGMDWHSSGITTSVIGALKRGLEPVAGELGVHVCGGRGSHSRKTPNELGRWRTPRMDAPALAGPAAWSRRWTAPPSGQSRAVSARLHRHRRRRLGGRPAGDERGEPPGPPLSLDSEGRRSFVEAPHAAIEGIPRGEIVNLTDRRANAPAGQLEFSVLGPDGRMLELARLGAPAAREAVANPDSSFCCISDARSPRGARERPAAPGNTRATVARTPDPRTSRN